MVIRVALAMNDFIALFLVQMDKWAVQVNAAPRGQHIRALLHALLPGCKLGC